MSRVWYEEKKNLSLQWEIKPMTFLFRAPMLYLWAKLNGKPGDYKVHAKASFFPFPHMFHDLTQKFTVKNYSTDICWLIDLSFIKEQFYNWCRKTKTEVIPATIDYIITSQWKVKVKAANCLKRSL